MSWWKEDHTILECNLDGVNMDNAASSRSAACAVRVSAGSQRIF